MDVLLTLIGMTYTANPNPVQLTGKYLLSLQGNPFLIAGSLFSLQGFPCISLYFPVRDCSVRKQFFGVLGPAPPPLVIKSKQLA